MAPHRTFLRLFLLGCLLTSGCALERTVLQGPDPGRDGGRDAGPGMDAGRDSDSEDAGSEDSGASDSGRSDSGPIDSGTRDTGVGDSGFDSGPVDSGSGDGSVFIDATPVDACVPTAESCNGLDDNCNGVIDDGTICGCTRAEFKNSVYQFCDLNPLNWSDARTACLSVGYDLVSINSMEEQVFLKMTTDSINDVDRWIGMARVSGQYVFVDGTVVWDGGPLTYHNFRGGMPTPNGPSDRCVEFDDGGGEWAVVDCTQAQRFICERD